MRCVLLKLRNKNNFRFICLPSARISSSQKNKHNVMVVKAFNGTSLHSFSACIIINSIYVSASILSIRFGMRTSLWRSIFVFLFSPSAGVCHLCLFSFKLVASPSPFIRMRRAIIARAKITIGHGPETHQTI